VLPKAVYNAISKLQHEDTGGLIGPVDNAASPINLEDAFLTREMSAAVDRVIAKLASKYPQCAVGAELLYAELDTDNRKEATHLVAARTGYSRHYLWSCRRALIADLREVLQ
jgi:hypothetical protein